MSVVRTDVDGAVAVVTVNRPEVLNAMNLEVFQELTQAAADLGRMDQVRAVVVTGAGTTFSSGLDTGLFGAQAAAGDPAGVDIAALQRAFSAYTELPQPVIAAVRGHCLGGGLQLALACDLRVVAEDASLSALEVRWGIIPDLGAIERLPRIVGTGRAMEMVLSARPVSGTEALLWGLANRAVPADRVLGEARAWAEELAGGPPLALAAAKRLVNSALDAPVHTGLPRAASAQRRILASQDFREAVSAALERRLPVYRGR